VKKACERFNLPVCADEYINKEILRQRERLGAVLVRAEDSPYWDENHPHLGVFAEDNGHYLAKTQEWFADNFMSEILEGQ